MRRTQRLASDAIAPQIAPPTMNRITIDQSAIDPATIAALRDVDTSPRRLEQYRYLDSAERRRVLLALYLRDGLTAAKIAEAVQLHPSNIGRQLERAGVKATAPKRTTRKRVATAQKTTRSVPTEVERIAKERVRDALAPLTRASRRDVLDWAQDVFVAH